MKKSLITEVKDSTTEVLIIRHVLINIKYKNTSLIYLLWQYLILRKKEK
jgi:hypothetical protein